MRLILFLALPLCLFSCKGKPAKSSINPTKDTAQFFQVSQYIQQQIDEVNKTPFYIYKRTIKNGKMDSVAINNQQFTMLAKSFMQPDISSPGLKKEYVETVFFDQTTKTYTLNYSTKNKTLEIQNIDVLLNEDAQTMKHIFIRKFINYHNDSTAIEQLSWKPDEQFQVSRMVQKPNQGETSSQTIVVWNDKN